MVQGLRDKKLSRGISLKGINHKVGKKSKDKVDQLHLQKAMLRK